MDDTNASLKGSKPIGGVNGSVKSALNGHTVGPKTRRAATGPGILSRIFNVVARLLTWYSILTILLRCPSTLDSCDESSPRICKPYFQLKHTVAPHLEPYYDTYAAPYVDLVRPYYNTVDEKVVAPGWRYAKKYGAPRIEQVQVYTQAQWEKNVQPQIAKGQHVARLQYDQNLAPHVDRVSTALGPYYDIARTSALQTYHEVLLPSYQYVYPYAQQVGSAASAFTTETAVPSVLWAWNKTYLFLDGTVWPQLRVIYVENVEPQLVKIGKRLGRYNSGKKTVPKPVAEVSASPSSKTTSSFVKPMPSTSSSTVASTVLSVSSSTSSPTDSPTSPSASDDADHTGAERPATESARILPLVEPVSAPEADGNVETEDPAQQEVRETVAADLHDWQERYSKAAEEGASEINNQVTEISKRMIRRHARVTGKSLLEELRTSVVSELVQLRRDILRIVGAVNKGSATPEQGQEEVILVVRKAGMAIKEKAQNVRAWRENYETEMQAAITKAAESHFAILQNIKDLALQKIGMKWAWMDGITYRDWAKYHLLKDRFDEWRADLHNLIVTHPSLEAAQLEGANIEDDAMKLAASAAKELARLKQVGAWKITAADETPEFDSTLMQQAAEAVEAAKNSVVSVVENAVESAVGAKDAIVEMVKGAAEVANGATDRAEEAEDTILQKAEHIVTSVSDDLLPVHTPNSGEATAKLPADSNIHASEVNGGWPIPVVYPETPEPATAAPEQVAEPTSDVEQLPSEGDEAVDQSSPDIASTILLEEAPVMVANATELNEHSSSAVEPTSSDETFDEPETVAPAEELSESSAPTPVKSAFLGVAAQSVPSRKPILEDALEDGMLESMQRDLDSVYSAATSRANAQYSQAISIISAQIHGMPDYAHQTILASVTAGYSQAMASASAHLDGALKAVSEQLYGTPTTTDKILPTLIPVPAIPSIDWTHIESIAAERLNQGRAWAEEQYESVKIAMGAATPTPSTPSEHANKMLENARHNYYASLGVAYARYSEFLAAASSAISSMTAAPTPTDLSGTASSIASVAGESAASAASVLSENVSSAAAAGYDSATAVADRVAGSWDDVVTKISIQIYGAPTPTPWYASVYSAAGEYASSATDAVGDGTASVTSAAGAYAALASEEASRQYVAVSSIMLELLVGKEPTFTESVLSRLAAAYVTGVASASSLASAAQATAVAAAADAAISAKSVADNVVSAASEATNAIKEAVDHTKDEL